MAKRISTVLVVTLLILACVCAFAACDKDKVPQGHPTTIVYIGDSIAEALIGPSPVSERDNYGYYALVGRANENGF